MSKQDKAKIPATVTHRCAALSETHSGVHTCGEPAAGLANGLFPACAKHGGK